MALPTLPSIVSRGGKLLLGGVVVGLTVPTGGGPGIGGWIAGHGTTRPGHGALAGGVVGLLGALPWAVLVYLASAGRIGPVGYHEGIVHVGITPASPALLSPTQEVAVAVLFGGVLVTFAAVGGLVAGMDVDVVGEVREAFATAA